MKWLLNFQYYGGKHTFSQMFDSAIEAESYKENIKDIIQNTEIIAVD